MKSHKSAAQILLIEDNPADVFLVREALVSHGIDGEIIAVEDGEQAITFLEQVDNNETASCPRMLILDLNLPKRTGEEVLARLRRSPKCKDIPVVVMTSSVAKKDQERAGTLGVDYYFVKPNDLDAFLAFGLVAQRLLHHVPAG